MLFISNTLFSFAQNVIPGELNSDGHRRKAKKGPKLPPAVLDVEEASLDGSYSGFDEETSLRVRKIAREMSYRSQDPYQHHNEDNSSSNFSQRNGRAASNHTKTHIEEVVDVVVEDNLEGINPFDGEKLNSNPKLDPKSPSFDSAAWIRNMKRVMDSDPDHFKPTALGVAFKDLRAYGKSSDADYQATVFNVPFKLLGSAWDAVVNRNDTSHHFDILKPMNGLIKRGTVTVVLGRPGAGCTTFLRTISAHTHGFKIGSESVISYDGLTPSQIRNNYRGDVTYSAETDVHFPHLTVGQTLNFAASLRVPQNRPEGISRDEYAERITQVYMAMYGLSHTNKTNVGNDVVRGVSGGERKRVSIAEVSLCGSYLQCWDNATRGLDSATALEFIKALKTQAQVMDVTSLIAIYQCSQDAYDLFDNCILLYEGHQIYSGPAHQAKDYFFKMGYECPARQSTADFLTSITNPAERIIRKGFEKKVPRTPKQFYDFWQTSPENDHLTKEVDSYIAHCQQNSIAQEFAIAHRARQADHTRKSSSFTVSYWMQIRALMYRNWLRTKRAPFIAIGSIVGNIVMAVILSSLFYNLKPDTSSFYVRGAAMFFAVLFNALASFLEIMALFEARPVVEKHKQYALYHPSADAFASILTEMPAKIAVCIAFNLVYYFMINFRRDAGSFFFYLLMNFAGTLAMSHFFRTIGSMYTSLSAAMTPASVFLLAFVMYAGFTLPTTSMLAWSRWINYINPMAYTFEAVMANEFHGRNFPCTQFIPSGGSYNSVDPIHRVCAVIGSVAGQTSVSGTEYLKLTFEYEFKNRWRSFGILIAFIIFFLITYLIACEWNKGAMQRGEITLFPKNKLKKIRKQKKKMLASADIESASSPGQTTESAIAALTESQHVVDSGLNQLEAGNDIFHWRSVCYDVQIGKETRRILNNVDGWIKPGTLTALMGASGAGKTTLLDVLASRVTMGTIYGHMFVNGHHRDASFQRSTGYAQQQDLHCHTSTVREALRFSAYLRQPASVSKEEKNAYVESVISILEMESYADAVVGVPGEGLNVEQRKRLTIGVELAARPKLLLFLDEPTSGLDSQTAWSVCQLMRKLANHGQAVLCTIHQPSALLIQEFDRLLFLAKGGKTVYFGDLGKNAKTLIKYFESHGAPKCPPEANPVEWMLEVIGAAPGSHANQDYHQVWLNSKQYQKVQKELVRMEAALPLLPRETSKESHREFAASYWTQYVQVTKRVLEQYYRTPTYIWSKILLTILSSLFIGFTFFNADASQQGLQNQMLSIFMFVIILNPLVDGMMPHFIYQRSLYEARERPSKTFSWVTWVLAQITAELPWQILIGTLGFLCWFYPTGFYHNAEVTNTVSERSVLVWLLVVFFFMFISTWGQMWAAAFDEEVQGGYLSFFCFTMCLNFCGVLKYPTGFWTWMYHVSPLTWFIQSLMSATVGNNKVVCDKVEFVKFNPPVNSTCGEYLNPYISAAGGYLVDPNASENCNFCVMSETNAFLKNIHTEYDDRWRNWGIFICYVFFNILLCLLFYWIARVPKGKKKVNEQSQEEADKADNNSEKFTKK
jgi:ATP-binding cassette subfamily G (WHITE) protein 2 (PDR)